MALFNVSTCSSELPPKASLSPQQNLTLPANTSLSPPAILRPRYTEHLVVNNRLEASGSSALSLGESVCKASLIALLSASVFVADPALAFKSILRQANFKGAKLLGASFFDADLTGADLSDADLRAVDFSLANVTKANMSNANLEGAVATGNTSFKGSNIAGVDFTDVPLREDQREYLCKVADRVNPTTGNPTRKNLLCN